GIRSASGQAMASVSWQFTTSTNLTVTSTTPAAMASGVSPAVHVSAVFSRAVDPSTLTATRFTLRDTAGNSIGAQLAYDANTPTATLTPTAALQTFVSYLPPIRARIPPPA